MLSAVRRQPYRSLFLFALIGAAGLLAALLWASRLQAFERAATESANIAWLLEDHIDSTFRRTEADLANIAQRLPPTAMTQAAAPRFRASLSEEMARHKVRFHEVGNFFVFDAQGQLLYSSDATIAPFSIADRDHFKALKNNPHLPYVFSDVIVAKTTQHPTMTMAKGIRDPQGRFAGIVSALLNFNYFQDTFDSIQKGPHGIIGLRTTDSYKLLMRSPQRPEEINKPAESAVSRRIAAGERIGTARSKSIIDGVERTLSFRVLKNYPFNVNVAFADVDVLVPWWRQVIYTVVVTGVFFLLFGVLLWRIWRGEIERGAVLKRLQEQEESLIQAKVVAEGANAAKSKFLASMSHELRTPLNAVLGFSQLLGMDEDVEPSVRERAGEIERAGQHLLMLVNDILDLARIESNKIEINLVSVDLDAMLDECARLIRVRAEERRIQIEIPKTGVQVLADHVRLRQVLLNLLSNAVKYNREGGRIAVHGSRRQDGCYRISVTDSGPGLPSDQVQELFKPFNRLGAELGTVEGTGIGLVITKSLVSLMNGTIGVESTQGVGSTFWIELPLAPVEA